MSTAPAASAAAAAKATISVEYAKSGRATCKVCSERIAKGALRLGTSTRDPRGYDSTKWYHVACFPSSSHPLDPVEKVKGFDSIKEEDREEVRELNKKHKRDQNTVGPTEESSPKKVKGGLLSPAAGVAENASISVEYAKSGRSTCKGCSENIAKGVLRLGTSICDPRGFDSTKWYHIVCFPASTYPAFHVENIKGFDSIKNQDRDKLQELEENCKRDGNVTDQLNEPNLKKEVVHSMEDSKGTENNLESVKMLAGDKRAGPVISFSVSDIKKSYKDATLPALWKVFNTVIFREQDDGLQSSAKIAAFDFDGCLAKTSVRMYIYTHFFLQKYVIYIVPIVSCMLLLRTISIFHDFAIRTLGPLKNETSRPFTTTWSEHTRPRLWPMQGNMLLMQLMSRLSHQKPA
ncbi:hypothetical protein E2562_028299 [Oryza meyeriana var. granulata]|uniref:PARP-type domain-containing protein n=1 Tax=Oryza meyeriana var. granulata TaxID=110450 RepID=A0A6G1E3T9_9ORYZ|nr:hypothetical protein E2562_028299 [Oryza meyeriana var. granulata]